MKKRGQLIGMPIVYIMIAVVMGLVLFFGFDSLSKVMRAKEITEVSKFVLDLEDEVEVMYGYDIGSAKKFSSRALNKKISYVCFFNSLKPINLQPFEIDNYDEELGYYLGISSKDNLYILPIGIYPSPYPDYYINHFKIEDSNDNPTCFANGDRGVEFVLKTYLENNQIYVGADEI
ncbi:MAG: hypothetical protein Q8Q42_01985 [Nanoarchaeota archaeon]|nr:hypothetical protein [Nanoarchaeota archaeon]